MRYKKLKTLWAAIERELGHNESSVERALDLDQGTIKKEMKKSKPDPALMHILKMVYTYPWILRVADHDYDQKYAKKEMLKCAIDIFKADMIMSEPAQNVISILTAAHEFNKILNEFTETCSKDGSFTIQPVVVGGLPNA